MILSETSIRRPVFATVLSLLILLVGAVSFQSLSLREYPKIDEPVVSVQTRFGGASSEVIENQVTKILEDSIAGIEGVDVITSTSRQERSQITVRFSLAREADSAAADVRDKVSRVRQRLPQGIDEPVIAKVEADAQPVIFLSLSSDTHNALQLSAMANQIVKPVLQTAPGAADVTVFGERKFSMQVSLDAERLSAYKLTPADVEDAIRKANIEVPSGRIEGVQREFSVTAATDLQKARDFSQVVVRTVNGQSIRIGDVGRVYEGPADERTSVRLNGKDSVGVGIIRQAQANPLDLSAGVRALIPKVLKDLPPGVSVEVANDNSVFIDRSINAVFKTFLEAAILVALVVFLFLRTLRASIIPLLAIPVALVGAFALMAMVGYTINTLTLLALVLAIGLVVDDAIVMLENIYRHIEEGLPPFQAALKGAREVGFAIVAMTLTLVAVYLPLGFTPGRTGRLFSEFALALSGAVVVSGLVALTLSPMLSSLLLRHNPKPSFFDRGMEKVLVGMTHGYSRLLRFVLRNRWTVVVVMVASGAASWWVMGEIKRELSPIEDRGVVLAQINAPDGSTLAYTNKYAKMVEKAGEKAPEFDRIFSTIGNPTVAQGNVFFRAIPWEDRTRTTMELAREMGPKVAGLPGVNVNLITPPSLGQGFTQRPINFVITTSESYQNLAQTARAFQDAMAKNPGFVQVDSDLRLNKPEIRLEVDRERAADAGVQVDTVARTIETMLGGRVVTRYKRDGEQFDVVVQTAPSGRDTPDDIEKLFVRGKGDAMIPLSALVKVREVVAPRELNHFGQRRSVSLTANLSPEYSLGKALEFMDETAKTVLKPGYSTDLNGLSREYRSSSSSLGLVFVLALVFIFLVLAAQFESFVDPLVIMLSVPLSMAGALLALYWSGGSLNVFSQIGLITLVGLITKHGILIVEFANQLRTTGLSVMEAISQSAVQRLRPIMMTTGAMVLGAVPLALATGAGAESRRQIGWVIVGGMTLGSLLTIFVVPAMYTLFARKRIPGPNTEPELLEAGVAISPKGAH
jgi:multidrug efflux pump